MAEIFTKEVHSLHGLSEQVEFTQEHIPGRISLGEHIPPASLVAQWERIHMLVQDTWVDLWVEKIPWRREWQMTLVSLPGKFHGQRSLARCNPWGPKLSTNNSSHNKYPRKSNLLSKLSAEFVFFFSNSGGQTEIEVPEFV